MLFLYVFITAYVSLSAKASEQRSRTNPCEDKTIVLKTALFNNTIKNSFRLSHTSTLFDMIGGSSSVTWYAKKPLVNDVWPEFFFFYEQAVVLRFIKVLLGFEPIVVSLTCTFDTASKNYSFSLHVNGKSFGFCMSGKKTYICSAGKMNEFFKHLERYKGGKSIVSELKTRAKQLQSKWSDVCQNFEQFEKNTTHVYLLEYDHITNSVNCSVRSSIPWRYMMSINGSVLTDTKTRYNRSNDIHKTMGSVSRKDEVYFICIITAPNGKNVSRFLDTSGYTTPVSTITSTSEYFNISITANAYTTIGIKKETIVKSAFVKDEIPTFGTGPVAAVVVMVVLVIALISLFIFREELTFFMYRFQKVPAESPYKDVIVTVGR